MTYALRGARAVAAHALAAAIARAIARMPLAALGLSGDPVTNRSTPETLLPRILLLCVNAADAWIRARKQTRRPGPPVDQYASTHRVRLVDREGTRGSAESSAITVAHRLSTVCNAGLIAGLGHGHVIEAGDHVSLIAAQGRCAALAA